MARRTLAWVLSLVIIAAACLSGAACDSLYYKTMKKSSSTATAYPATAA